MERTSHPRAFTRAIHQVPLELGAFLARDARNEQAYERLTLSGRRDLADWIEGAGTPVRRRSRARQAAAMIRGL